MIGIFAISFARSGAVAFSVGYGYRVVPWWLRVNLGLPDHQAWLFLLVDPYRQALRLTLSYVSFVTYHRRCLPAVEHG